MTKDGGAAPDLDQLFAPVAEEKAIGLAVSGGVDSLALMLMAHEWALGRQIALKVFSVDHRLRPQSGDECAFVQQVATRLGLEAEILRWEGEKPRAGLQAAARAARYRLLFAAMKAQAIKVLATGHQCEDQAETVLMRLAHGSGLEGLKGMEALSARDGVVLFRPLLGLGRAQLAARVAEAGLEPVDDPSNTQIAFERVRWRVEMRRLAELGLDAQRLYDFGERVTRADAALDHYTEQSLAKVGRLSSFGTVRLDVGELMRLPEEIGLRILRRSLGWAGGGQRRFALGEIEALFAGLCESREIAPRTMCGARVRTREGFVELVRENRHLPEASVMVDGGAVELWDQRFLIVNRNRDWPIRVGVGKGVTRRMAESVLQGAVEDPVAALRTTPIVWRGDGEILAIGGRTLSEDVKVELSGWAADLPRGRG